VTILLFGATGRPRRAASVRRDYGGNGFYSEERRNGDERSLKSFEKKTPFVPVPPFLRVNPVLSVASVNLAF
jgi:hypothetical protein